MRLPAVVVACVMLAVVALVAFAGPLLPGYDPYGQDLAHGMLSPLQDPAHLFGTDRLGRDVLSRASLATRITLGIVAGALAINLLLGLVLGMLAGYLGGLTDTLVMGLADLQLAIPLVLLLIVVVAVLGSSPVTLAVVMGLSLWVGYGRVARVVSMGLRDREFVLSARTQGAGTLRILRTHLLPGVVPNVVIMASFDTAVLVIVEASLSYLGLGIQPPTPSLGGMIAEGQRSLQAQLWLTLVPGIMIFLLVAGVQFLSRRFTTEDAATGVA